MIFSRAPIARFHRIAALLDSAHYPISVATIAARLEVSSKTIGRDLDYMRAGLALPISADRRGVFFTERVTVCQCCCRRVS